MRKQDKDSHVYPLSAKPDISEQVKNSAYGRHWLSQRVQRVALIPKQTEMDRKKNFFKENCKKKTQNLNYSYILNYFFLFFGGVSWPIRGLETDHVILGPMRDLNKKTWGGNIVQHSSQGNCDY